MNAWAVVVAAGRGERADLGTNKVFYPIGGVSVLTCCLRALESSGLFAGVALVLAPSDFEAYERLCAREGRCALVKKIAQGGNTRQASVENGLAVVPEEAQIVAIHDAARPFVSRETLQMSIELAQDTGSGVACTSVVDTIKQVDESGVVHTIDRASLRAAQTPQTFQRAQIVQAYCRARELGWTATDDADIYQRYFGRVTLFTAPGSERNIKLTTKEDFARMQTLCGFKVGIGYDAHRLVEGRALVLCGVTVPSTRGLAGHSDADVAVHALMDALLGAMGEGDIGRHFPDNDASLRGISSMILLERVMDMARERGMLVQNADVVIVAQKPKLAPYIEKMRENIANALGVSFDCANVKATTTEQMGFEGREEGISAQATVLLAKGCV